MTSGEVIIGHYDTWIVALSVLIGVMGGYCTIELAERVTATRHRARLYWWIGGAITMAIGTWSMHYTGMLALRLPVPLLYDWPTAFLSYLASLFASLIGLFVVSRRKMGIASIFAGSVFMGGGIVGLHYIAMGSMRLKAMHDYSPPIVTLFRARRRRIFAVVALVDVLVQRSRYWSKMAQVWKLASPWRGHFGYALHRDGGRNFPPSGCCAGFFSRRSD